MNLICSEEFFFPRSEAREILTVRNDLRLRIMWAVFSYSLKLLEMEYFYLLSCIFSCLERNVCEVLQQGHWQYAASWSLSVVRSC